MLDLRESHIEGTALFSSELKARRDRKRRRRWWLLIIGIFLCLLIIFIPLGIKLIKRSGGILRTRIRIEVEGEAYRARGADVSDGHAAEVFDVAADTRLALEAGAGRAKDNSNYEIEGLTKDEREIQGLRLQFEELKHKLEKLLPEISLPSVKGQEG